MFEKVLVCLDGSPLAEAILPYIAEESRHFSKIVFLMAIDAPVVSLPVGVPGESAGPVRTEAMLKEFRAALEKAPAYLDRLAEPLRAAGAEVETAVLEGNPAEVIIDYIRENDISLVALATHGHSGLRNIAMGSTAAFLLKNAGRPVLIVTPGKKG